MADESEDLMGEKDASGSMDLLRKHYAGLVEYARKQRAEIEDLERINASLYGRLCYAKERVKFLEGPSHTPEEWLRIKAAEGTVEFVPATPSAASPRYWEQFENPEDMATAEDWPRITSTVTVHGPGTVRNITERQGRYKPTSKLGDLLANMAELTMDHPLLPGDRVRIVLEKGEAEGSERDETQAECERLRDPDVSALIAERQKHRSMNYNDAHDAREDGGQLAMAAAYMAYPKEVSALFPDDWDPDLHSFRERKTRYEQLRVAGGLVLAEMRRVRLAALARPDAEGDGNG